MGTLTFAGCSKAEKTANAPSALQIENETKKINDWFEARYQDSLARSPAFQTYLGINDNQDKLDDASQAAIDEEYALEQNWYTQMKAQFNLDLLDTQGKISYRLYEYDAKEQATAHPFDGHIYVLDHMSGEHTGFPTFMINFHAVNTVEDAKAYISRLTAGSKYLKQYQDRIEAQHAKGITLPKFAYPKMITSSQNVITGAPFTDGDDSPIFADFKAKVTALKDVDDATKADLITHAETVLKEGLHTAYKNLISSFEEQEETASTDDGVWKLPDGADFYQSRLNHFTTTTLTADEIHNIGLKEVARIQNEMRKIMVQVGFEGTLQDFYNHLRTDPKFTLPNDDAGRTQYMKDATATIDNMKAKLDSLFITKPKADMVVKRVEPFRENSAGGAFYELPALDGSRPGTYFVNLRDLAEQPTYLLQALAYHEGIPGHHMQIAIAMELEGIPQFRKLGGHTAYIEGWALYAESVPVELELYSDPYSDFGRLSMEIFRAARLVVDTGIHSKKWTREQAVQYMLENIANPEGDIRSEIDRYIVWPGQATAYKIGMLKIQELKAKSQTALGDTFDIREFHDVILANGSVPLSILEELVDEYIASNQ